MGIVTWCGATGAGDGVVNRVPERQAIPESGLGARALMQCTRFTTNHVEMVRLRSTTLPPTGFNKGCYYTASATLLAIFLLLTPFGNALSTHLISTLPSIKNRTNNRMPLDAHQLTWPWWCRRPSPWRRRWGGGEGWGAHTWLQASRWAGPPLCDG